MNRKTQTARSSTLWALVILLVMIGIGALVSGPMLFLSPNGDLIKIPVEILQGTPFQSYLIPGIILFLFVGIFPLLVGYGLLRRPDWSWAKAINACSGYHWSWTASWASGVILIIWIIVETVLLGYISFLQPLIAVWGISIIALTLRPNIRRYYIIPS